MNYLAHSLLSDSYEEILIGNFVADHLTPAGFLNLNDPIKKGVLIHRKIDSFTDNHPLFKSTKRFFYDGFEKYSGVLVDIYFDHLLASNFSKYSNIDLNTYSRNVYALLEQNKIHLPVSSQKFLEYITKNNTFFEYSKINGIELVLRHLSYRIKHKVDLSLSLPLFVNNKEKIEKDFFVFFEELQTYIKNELQ